MVILPSLGFKVGTLPPLIDVAGTTLVIVTVPPGPAVGTLPLRRSFASTLVVVSVVKPWVTVKVSSTTVRVAAPTVTTKVCVPVQFVGFNTSQYL